MKLGAQFAKWGLGLFIFGVFLSFGIIAHYCAGSRWPNGALFMQNIYVVVGVSLDTIGGSRPSGRSRHGRARPLAADGGPSVINQFGKLGKFYRVAAVHCGTAWRVCGRLSWLLRLRCHLAEFLLLADRRR